VRGIVRLLVAALGVFAVVVPGGAAKTTSVPSPPVLLARFAPILVLHPLERFAPVPVDGFLADSDLERQTASGWERVDGPPPAGGADLRLDERYCDPHQGIAAAGCYADAEAKHAASPAVYGATFRRGNRIALQYWLFYPYDDFSPTVPPGGIWQVHEGDWESVSVIVDLQGAPQVVGLSSHCDGTQRTWAKAPKQGTHPIVYVALGSHANFFTTGHEPLRADCWTKQVITIIKAYGALPIDHTAKGRVVRPAVVRVTSKSPSWMAFAGTWGETGYVHFPGNDPIENGAGPRGPAFHQQWRAPVATVTSWRLG
jgi:hypothetical protein